MKKNKGGAARRQDSADTAEVSQLLNNLSGFMVMAGIAVIIVLALRLAGAFPHPSEHMIGVICWVGLTVLCLLRSWSEVGQGPFPLRWGSFLMMTLAFLASVGLLVEITLATDPMRNANQPDAIFRMK